MELIRRPEIGLCRCEFSWKDQDNEWTNGYRQSRNTEISKKMLTHHNRIEQKLNNVNTAASMFIYRSFLNITVLCLVLFVPPTVAWSPFSFKAPTTEESESGRKPTTMKVNTATKKRENKIARSISPYELERRQKRLHDDRILIASHTLWFTSSTSTSVIYDLSKTILRSS